MASISFTVTDSKNGVMNSSFSFSDADINRISGILRSVYRESLSEDPKDDEVFACLGHNLIHDTLNSVYQEEVRQKIEIFKLECVPIEVK